MTEAKLQKGTSSDARTEPEARVAVIVFPGSLDNRDALGALASLGAEATPVWHTETELIGIDGVVLPGGFSYGDYLRCGAIARFSPVMRAVADFAGNGGPVLGICNGFQILSEANLLPGVLTRNQSLRFICRDVGVRVENIDTVFTEQCTKGQRLIMPVKNGEGCYISPEDLPDNQVLLRYQEPLNGSMDDIAGVINKEGNVIGLMPHPEHAVDPLLGSTDGSFILSGLIRAAKKYQEAA